MLSCEDVFHQQLLQCDNDLKDSTRMLVDCSTYVRADNGLVTFRFLNGLEVYRFPAGHIRYVLLST